MLQPDVYFNFEMMKSCFYMRFEGKMPAAVPQCASECSLCNSHASDTKLCQGGLTAV